MKFIVYGISWAGGLKNTPKEILEKYCAAKPVEFMLTERNTAPHLDIEITADEMLAMVSSPDFDIMTICARDDGPKTLAFDAPGKRFKQR